MSLSVVLICHVLTNWFVVSQLPPAMKDFLLRPFTMNVPGRKKKTAMQAENKGSLT